MSNASVETGTGAARSARPPAAEPLRVGSTAHRDLLCRTFRETHDPYEVAAIDWPALAPEEHRLLTGLPVWDQAVGTEHEAALAVRAMADHEADPVLAEAIALQAFEEERHSQLVSALVDHYGIPVRTRELAPPPRPVWAFARSGWGEHLDSFFAFGVFAVARDAEIVPPGLLAVFDTVMQEEARHILFFENWRLHQRASAPSGPVPVVARDVAAAAMAVVDRLRAAVAGARGGTGDEEPNFLFVGLEALGGVTPRTFVDTCLQENDRRLAPFDPRLARPRTVPRLARAVRRFLPNRPFGAASKAATAG